MSSVFDSRDNSLARIRERLRGILHRRRRPKSHLQARFDTSDILQESMVQVHEELGKGDRTGTDLPNAWLVRVVDGHESKLIDRHRAGKRDANLARPLVDTLIDQDRQTAEKQACLLYTSPSPRDLSTSRMPSSA